jgi:hypothetical protein
MALLSSSSPTCARAVRVSLAAFLDAVVIADPVRYQHRRDERGDVSMPLRSLHFIRGPSYRCNQCSQGHWRRDSVVSVQLAHTMHAAVVLIIRRSWVRAPPAPPATRGANSASQVCASKTSTLHRAAPLRLIRASAVTKGTWRASANATY